MALSAAGPHACPFVALADDRDARSTAPDQAHRCYAEERPEPRPLSHQRAYCLTREYAVCPYFLEWAGRLAARKVGQALEPFPGRYESAGEQLLSPLAIAADPAFGVALGASTASADAELGVASRRRLGAGTAAPAGPGSAQGLVDADEIEEIDETGRLVDRERWPVGPGRSRASIALPLLDRVRHGIGYGAVGNGEPAIDGEPEGESLDPRGRTIGERARIFGDRARNFGGRRAGPDWEPRRIEDDYPTLRVPVKLPPIPPLALAVLALLVAGLAILVVPGMLAGGPPNNSPQPGGQPVLSATPRSSASVAAASPTATERPRPRFRNYTVKEGDTFVSIAKRFGMTVRQLRNANPKVTNPDRIRVGDKLRVRRAAAQATPSPSG